MSAEPRCSIVVPCYNRAAYLEHLLLSLTWSTTRPSDFEVVVVNDGGSDDVHGVAARWRQRGLDVTCIESRPPGPARNNAKARNAGWRAARGPLIIQTDPEIVFTTDVLQCYRRAIRPGHFLSCGAFYQLTCDASAQLMNASPAGIVLPSDYLTAAADRPNQVNSPDGVGALHGAFGVWRHDLEAIGGYDESFGEWGWEDRELLVTLQNDSGLERDRVAAIALVHLWHAPQRSQDRRAELLPRGQLSDTAWRVQFQRARAESPRSRRRLRGIDLADTAPADDRFRPDRYCEVVSGEDRQQFEAARAAARAGGVWAAAPLLPEVYQHLFRTMELEVVALRSLGQAAAAVATALDTLSCPWETCDARDGTRVESDEGLGAPVSSMAPCYAAAPALLAELALACADAGERERLEAALAALERWQGTTTGSDLVRLRLALARGDVDVATTVSARLAPDAVPASGLPLLLEVELNGRRWASARDLAARMLASPQASHFDRLGACASLLWVSERAPSLAASDVTALSAPAAADTSEYLFSAAVRCTRAGCDLIAAVLFERFLAAHPPVEARLFDDAERHLSTLHSRPAWVRWSSGFVSRMDT